MIEVVVIVLVVVALVSAVLTVTDPSWQHTLGEIERQLHRARRSRQLEQLRLDVQRDAARVRRELDAEFDRIDQHGGTPPTCTA